MAEEKVTLMDGKLHVYRRENSRFWQCSTFLGGRNHRATTKEEQQHRAEEFARDWFAECLVDEKRRRRGDPSAVELTQDRRRRKAATGPTFRDAAERFMNEFEVITQGQRSPFYVKAHRIRLDRHLLPFFGDRAIADITSGDVTDYRAHRMKTGLARRAQFKVKADAKAAPEGEPISTDHLAKPARSTLHQEIVCLRQVLKTALRHNWITHLPDLSEPYRKAPKISHRAWFSPTEYKQLYEATRERAKNPPKPRWRAACENLHDFVLFMVNTGLRPDEALRLEFRDVAIVTDEATGERILEIEVRGKRGVGFCKSMPGAVMPFRRIQERSHGKATDRVFPTLQRELFNTVLEELGLKTDREGQARTFYSLRHTYICMRLMEGADIYQIAKNCRTSVEMIENYYASHIKNTLDAAAINVRKAKPIKRATKKSADDQPTA